MKRTADASIPPAKRMRTAQEVSLQLRSDVLTCIFSIAPVRDVVRLMVTCKTWFNVAEAFIEQWPTGLLSMVQQNVTNFTLPSEDCLFCVLRYHKKLGKLHVFSALFGELMNYGTELTANTLGRNKEFQEFLKKPSTDIYFERWCAMLPSSLFPLLNVLVLFDINDDLKNCSLKCTSYSLERLVFVLRFLGMFRMNKAKRQSTDFFMTCVDWRYVICMPLKQGQVPHTKNEIMACPPPSQYTQNQSQASSNPNPFVTFLALRAMKNILAEWKHTFENDGLLNEMESKGLIELLEQLQNTEWNLIYTEALDVIETYCLAEDDDFL